MEVVDNPTRPPMYVIFIFELTVKSWWRWVPVSRSHHKRISVVSLFPAPPYPLQDFKALYKCYIIITINKLADEEWMPPRVSSLVYIRKGIVPQENFTQVTWEQLI